MSESTMTRGSCEVNEWPRFTLEFVKTKDQLPEKHIGVLVLQNLVGPIFDVAVYTGLDADGGHRWIMSDIDLDHSLIKLWAYLPDEEITNNTG